MQLHTTNLTQRFSKDTLAVDRITLTLKPGITGLLGPNGAGKSSLMRMLATIAKPSSGEISLNEQNIFKSLNAYRAQLGYLPQYFGVYDNLSAVEFLSYLANIKGVKKAQADSEIERLLSQLNLSEVKAKPMSSYSGGMRQRVGIAQALLNNPKIVIFDEPTVGLDPDERARFRDMLTELSTNSIVILSTHIVSDLESSADNIAIMQKGKIVACNTTEQLLHEITGKVWLCRVPVDSANEFKKKHVVTHTKRAGDYWEMRVVSNKPVDEKSTLVSPSLEEAYVYHSNRARIDAKLATDKEALAPN